MSEESRFSIGRVVRVTEIIRFHTRLSKKLQYKIQEKAQYIKSKGPSTQLQTQLL